MDIIIQSEMVCWDDVDYPKDKEYVVASMHRALAEQLANRKMYSINTTLEETFVGVKPTERYSTAEGTVRVEKPCFNLKLTAVCCPLTKGDEG